ncbi:MAG: hypothetical protein J6C62_02190, partial [Clostridia bacterium]|nr:hypothetical protein [Clostridia bacterium]
PFLTNFIDLIEKVFLSCNFFIIYLALEENQFGFYNITSVMCYNWGQHNKRYVVFELWPMLATPYMGVFFMVKV